MAAILLASFFASLLARGWAEFDPYQHMTPACAEKWKPFVEAITESIPEGVDEEDSGIAIIAKQCDGASQVNQTAQMVLDTCSEADMINDEYGMQSVVGIVTTNQFFCSVCGMGFYGMMLNCGGGSDPMPYDVLCHSNASASDKCSEMIYAANAVCAGVEVWSEEDQEMMNYGTTTSFMVQAVEQVRNGTGCDKVWTTGNGSVAGGQCISMPVDKAISLGAISCATGAAVTGGDGDYGDYSGMGGDYGDYGDYAGMGGGYGDYAGMGGDYGDYAGGGVF